MNRRIIILIMGLLLLLTGVSCATTARASYEDKKRGLLMLEGEDVYKNKGFYKKKYSYGPYKKKNNKALKKKMRAYKKRNRL